MLLGRVHLNFGILLLLFLARSPIYAQLVKWGDSIPRRSNPPVLLVAGHTAFCEDILTDEFFTLTFGKFHEVLARAGRVSLYFESCQAPTRLPIEGLAAYLGILIEKLRYDDGQPVDKLDVVAHSMGGLILRSYLSGKESIRGVFTPPVATRIRRAIFIATPHFGTAVADSFDGDPQVRAMALGSQFLFEQATWNQSIDDLRGVDSLSIIGTAGINNEPGFTDSVVLLTSASLGFVARDRTIVLPLCHTFGGIGALFLCPGAFGLSRVNDEQHPSARAVLSFLDGTSEWQGIGTRAEQNPILSESAALIVQLRTPNDEPVRIETAALQIEGGTSVPLNVSNDGFAYTQKAPAGRARIIANDQSQEINVHPGGGRALIVKQGPVISRVEPAAGPTWPLALAPGMRIEVKGLRLNDGEVAMTANEIPVTLIARSAESLDAVLPEAISGLVMLKVQTAAGQHAIRILIESENPVLYKKETLAAALHADTGAPITMEAPAARNEVISLFLTGLGDTVLRGDLSVALREPSVTIGGDICEVIYAGRAPGLPGIDQINCRIPDSASGTSEVVVTSGIRSSGTVLPVR